MEKSLTPRRYDIDWLRALTMLAIFLFHCACFFSFDDWHVKNVQRSLAAATFTGFLVQWIMPVMFVISGIGSRYALEFRSGGQYLGERVKRLFIPLVFGVFILSPHQVYFERLTHSQFSGSFWQFLPHYFDGFYAFGGNFAWMGLHLWFLLYLLIYSLLCLPLFLRLRTSPGLKLAAFLEKPGALFMLALPLAAAQAALDPRGILGMQDTGGWSMVIYLVFFCYGYLLASHPRISDTIERQHVLAGLLGLLSISLMFYLYTVLQVHPAFGTAQYTLLAALRAFNSWFWIVFLLGLTSRRLSFDSGLRRYSNQAVMPFYVLHQPIILLVGFFVVRWDIGVLPKYLLISAASFILIMLVYELLVKCQRWLRFLTGMKHTSRS
ncbi:MAG: acyltransferase family protein [Firmicutes bacterium]|nr:acyltransferase family protein [Bacillota bacterium]